MIEAIAGAKLLAPIAEAKLDKVEIECPGYRPWFIDPQAPDGMIPSRPR